MASLRIYCLPNVRVCGVATESLLSTESLPTDKQPIELRPLSWHGSDEFDLWRSEGRSGIIFAILR